MRSISLYLGMNFLMVFLKLVQFILLKAAIHTNGKTVALILMEHVGVTLALTVERFNTEMTVAFGFIEYLVEMLPEGRKCIACINDEVVV